VGVVDKIKTRKRGRKYFCAFIFLPKSAYNYVC